MVILGIGLLVWSFIAWYIAVPLGLLVVLWGYFRAIQAADTYGLLLRSGFDLYRFDLFKQLHLSPPKTPGEEFEFGMKVTQALGRGFKVEDFTYKHPEK
jgi:hypothetical protein